jgi:hypothetical protein
VSRWRRRWLRRAAAIRARTGNASVRDNQRVMGLREEADRYRRLVESAEEWEPEPFIAALAESLRA